MACSTGGGVSSLGRCLPRCRRSESPSVVCCWCLASYSTTSQSDSIHRVVYELGVDLLHVHVHCVMENAWVAFWL